MYVSPKRTAEDVVVRTTDEYLAPLNVNQKHLERWHNIAFDIYLSLTESCEASNSVVCVPQIIATLEIFAQVASPTCRKFIRDLIFPENSASLICNGSLASYIEEWEKTIHEAAHPGNFFTQRRFLVHPLFTKSYGFETFTTLKSMGTEVKIFNEANFNENMTGWLRNACKITGIPDRVMPVHIWPLSRCNQQTINNQKCPILISASHFEFSIKSNVLDCEQVYKIKFFPHSGKPTSVSACRLQCTNLCPFKSLKLGDKSSMIPLPSSCENVSLFIIDNCDAIDIKNGGNLQNHVLSMDKAQPNRKITSMYLPLFFDFPTRATNVGHALSCSVNHMDKLFQQNAFGDLAYDGSEPSATNSLKTASNIQSFDYIEMTRRPGSAEAVPAPSKSDQVYVVSQPFAFIVWDNIKKISIYIARIGAPDSTDGGEVDESKHEGSESKTQKNKNVMGFLKLRGKKTPKSPKKVTETVEMPLTQRTELN